MASYSTTDGILARKTLAANTVDTVTITPRSGSTGVVLRHHGPGRAPIYYSIDGTTPVVGASDFALQGFDGVALDAGPVTLKLISADAMTYSLVDAALDELDTETTPLASPALTGTPTAPTAAVGTNTTQIATTAFVRAAAGLVFSVKGYGATGDGTTDDRTAIQAAITAAQAVGGAVLFDPGTYKVSASIDVTAKCSLIGAPGATITVASGFTDPVIDVQCSSVVGVSIVGLTIDLTAASGATGLHLQGVHSVRVSDLVINGGAKGIHVTTNVFGGVIERIRMRNNTIGCHLSGDLGGEIAWTDIDISRQDNGTTEVGWWCQRTTASDVGGNYLTDVRITRNAEGTGTVNSGFRISSTAASSTAAFAFFTTCVADQVNGTGYCYEFTNVTRVKMTGCWGMSANNNASVLIDGGVGSSSPGGDIQILACLFQPDDNAPVIEIANAAQIIDIGAGTRATQGDRWFEFTGTSPTLITWDLPVSPVDICTSDADYEILTLATIRHATAGLSVYTHADSGPNATLGIVDAETGDIYHFRHAAGALQLVNPAFSAVILSVGNTGVITAAGLTASGAVSGGTGAFVGGVTAANFQATNIYAFNAAFVGQFADATNGTPLLQMMASGATAGRGVSIGPASLTPCGGDVVVAISNCVAAPSSNPVGGGILYAEAGALKWRGSSGTVTTIAPA